MTQTRILTNVAEVTFNLNGFTLPNSVTRLFAVAYFDRLSNTITARHQASSWVSFSHYGSVHCDSARHKRGTTATKAQLPEWDLNPDTIMVPAGGTVTLNPMIR